MEKICGIYCITNNINGKQYIGLSKDCLKRWADHYSKSLNSQKEDDKRKPLYMAMNKYGRDNFSFSILEECLEEELKEREVFWIDKKDTYYNGYNATLGGDLVGETKLKGELHGMHKLTLKEVEQCRVWYSEGKESSKIWNEYFSERITYAGFSKMWHGKTWKHVMPEVFNSNPRPIKKITTEEVLQMKQYFKEGKTCAEVYHIFEKRFSRTTINDIFHERRYSKIN